MSNSHSSPGHATTVYGLKQNKEATPTEVKDPQPEPKPTPVPANYDFDSWTIPTSGSELFFYKLKLKLSKKHQAAHEAYNAELRRRAEREHQQLLNKEQADRNAQQDLEDYAQALETALFEMSGERVMTLISSSSGSASKSTTAAYMASTLGAVMRRAVAIIDNNENFDPIAEMLGLDPRNTLSVRQLAQKVSNGDLNGDAGELQELLAWTRHSVALICSDQGNRQNAGYSHDDAVLVIDQISRKVGHGFINSGNNVSSDVIRAALEMSGSVIVPTIPTLSRMKGARDAIDNLSNLDQKKLKHSIVVVSGIEPGKTLELYRDYMNLPEEHVLLGTPYDQRLKDEAVVNLKETNLLTRIAYLEIELANVMVAAHFKHHRDDSPLKLKSGEIVPIPSKRKPVLPWVTTVNDESSSPQPSSTTKAL